MDGDKTSAVRPPGDLVSVSRELSVRPPGVSAVRRHQASDAVLPRNLRVRRGSQVQFERWR